MDERLVADPLVVRDVRFLGGMAAPGGWRPPPDLPEIAFSGRSNVGKSSLINRLIRRKALARVGQTPGKTHQINFYRVNDAFTLVDLPGYGFARVSKATRGVWRRLIEGYLRESEQLRGVVQLLDVRRDPAPDDLAVLDLLAELGTPVLVAVTKIDKLARHQVAERVRAIAQRLALDAEQVVPVSSATGAGCDELAAAVVELLARPSQRLP